MDNNLFDENASLVLRAANQAWEDALSLPAGSKERSSAMTDAEKTQSHVEKLIDMNNRAAETETRFEVEEDERAYNRKVQEEDKIYNRELEKSKAKESGIWKKVDTVVKCVEIGLTSAVALWCCRKQLNTYIDSLKAITKYEKDGSFLTTAGRTTANKFGQILKFK